MNYWGQSDRGKIRESNQDNFRLAVNQQGLILAIVCDGIGGGRDGDLASLMTCKKLQESFENNPEITGILSAKRWFRQQLVAINEEIYHLSMADDDGRGMGTTMVGLMVLPNSLLIVNCGDSRCYQLNKDQLKQITKDHTVVSSLVDIGMLSEEAAKAHPARHVLSSAIGVERNLRLDFFSIKNRKGTYLLCSDGLYGMLSDEEITKIIRDKNNGEKRVKDLVETANMKGGYDNITVVLLEE